MIMARTTSVEARLIIVAGMTGVKIRPLNTARMSGMVAHRFSMVIGERRAGSRQP